MFPQVLMGMASRGWLRMLRRFDRSAQEVYRMCFLARSGELGILEALSQEAASPVQLAVRLKLGAEQLPSLDALLKFGESLGELGSRGGVYRLKGWMAKSFVKPENDPWAAFAIEVATLHVRCFLEASGAQGRSQEVARVTDALAPVISRSSRIAEPLVESAVRTVVPGNGAFRILEIGCGTGVHVLSALRRNPEAQVTAVEREADVVAQAKARLAEAGLSGRCDLLHADVRDLSFGQEFDLITLYNNIYYFQDDKRAELLAQLRGWLKPGGGIALTSPCSEGRGAFSRLMLLWSTLCVGVGLMPGQETLCEVLRGAGYSGVGARALLPGGDYVLFQGQAR